VGKLALIKQQRYVHAKQFKRANRCLRTLKTYLGRVMRDIQRKIQGGKALEAAFAQSLSQAHRLLFQKKRQEAPKVYSLHAPEVECIGKGKAHKPYEFGRGGATSSTPRPIVWRCLSASGWMRRLRPCRTAHTPGPVPASGGQRAP